MQDVRRSSLESLRALNVDEVIIFGIRNPTHTHHYIHKSFYEGFASIINDLSSIKLSWVENYPVDASLFNKKLFLTYSIPGYFDSNVPISKNNYYLVHGTTGESSRKYLDVFDRTLFFDEFRGDPNSQDRLGKNYIAQETWQEYDNFAPDFVALDKLSSSPFEYFSRSTRTLVTAWATDVLPEQIFQHIRRLPYFIEKQKSSKSVVFVGSVWHRNIEVMTTLARACKSLNLRLEVYGGLMDDLFIKECGGEAKIVNSAISDEDARKLISEAKLAPSIQGEGQVGYYIPCRIFKNGSYGSALITNNPLISQILESECFVNEDISKLIYDSINNEHIHDVDYLSSSMIEIAENHTYLNRIDTMLKHLLL